MAVVVLCSGSGSGHPRDQFKLFRDKRPQITSTLIAPLFSLSGVRIYILKNWLTSSSKRSFFNWVSLREPLVGSLAFFYFGTEVVGVNHPKKYPVLSGKMLSPYKGDQYWEEGISIWTRRDLKQPTKVKMKISPSTFKVFICVYILFCSILHLFQCLLFVNKCIRKSKYDQYRSLYLSYHVDNRELLKKTKYGKMCNNVVPRAKLKKQQMSKMIFCHPAIRC